MGAMEFSDGGVFNRYLGMELWYEILSLLPVKTLLVFRAVCKSFLSIIDDPKFAPYHLRRFPDNINETQLVSILSEGQADGNLYEAICRQIKSSRSFIPSRKEREDGVFVSDEIYYPWKKSMSLKRVSCYLDGLALVSTKYKAFEDPVTFLWNLSIRKHRQIFPPTPEPFDVRDKFDLDDVDDYEDRFGIGYDASKNDYKVFAMPADEFWVYSLNAGSWTRVHLPDSLRPRDATFSKNFLSHNDDKKCYKDWMVWIGYDWLVLLEFATESFRCNVEMPYPAGQQENEYPGMLVLLDGGYTVGLLGYHIVEDQPYLWTLQTDTLTWIKRAKISHEFMELESSPGTIIENVSCVERDGHLVWSYYRSSDGKFGVVSYHIETKAIKSQQIFPGLIRPCIYIESLFMLSFNSSNSTSFDSLA